MRYQVRVTHSVNEVGRKLPPEIKQAARKAFKELAENPDLGKELQAELSRFRSYRFKRYRIIYQIDTANKQLIVWAIGHRRDIYETFGKHLRSVSAGS